MLPEMTFTSHAIGREDPPVAGTSKRIHIQVSLEDGSEMELSIESRHGALMVQSIYGALSIEPMASNTILLRMVV